MSLPAPSAPFVTPTKGPALPESFRGTRIFRGLVTTFRRTPTTQPFHELDSVVLIRDFPEAGPCVGDLGAVVHGHALDAFEVELIAASGRRVALRMLSPGDVRIASDDDVLAARPVRRVRR